MAEPLEANTDAAPVNNTAATDFTQHADATDARLTPAQLPEAVSHGLQSSLLNKLPPELRNQIWEMVLVNPKDFNFRADDPRRYTNSEGKTDLPPIWDLKAGNIAATASCCPQILWALNLMATCRQIRSETKCLLLDLNDINIHLARILVGPREIFTVQRSIALLKRIPSSLGHELGRVILCTEGDHVSYKQYGVLSEWKHPKLPRYLIKFAQGIHPFRLFLGLDFRFAGWVSGDKQVCGRDAPVIFDDCYRIRCKVPFGDRALALRAVDETIDRRLGLLRRHGTHRMCAVRAMSRKLESGLDLARQYMRDVVDLVIARPEEVTELALDLQQMEVS